jgi:hypothetical protein
MHKSSQFDYYETENFLHSKYREKRKSRKSKIEKIKKFHNFIKISLKRKNPCVSNFDVK